MEYQMKDLVYRCKKEDLLAKEELLSRLKPLVVASIKKFYYGNEDMEDMVQEGYLKILCVLKSFDTERGIPFLGYLKLQLKYFFMEKGKKDLFLDSKIYRGNTEAQGTLIDLLAGDDDIEEEFLKSEELRYLGQAIEDLTYRQKQIITLYFTRGMNMRLIARQLKIHYQTVVKTKERAVKILRKSYTKLF